METRRLHNSEMKRLVSILHVNASRAEIKNLPRTLHSSLLSPGPKVLCALHKGLDGKLLQDIWAWVKYEFETGIGKRVYPLMMAGKLSAEQEGKMRKMEGVPRMWDGKFKLEESAPPGREPIDTSATWGYEDGQCRACMLARIGSDTGVLCALYAGMIARFPMHKLSTGRVVLAELGVARLDNPKSKRVRLVRYWIRARERGEAALFEAVELGIVIKKMYRLYKSERGCANNADSGPTIVNPTALSLHTEHMDPEPMSYSHPLSYASSTMPAPLVPQKYCPAASSIYSCKSSGSSFSTILSYDGGPEQSGSSFTTMLSDDGAHMASGPRRSMVYDFPEPAKRSVYGSYGDVEWDPFEAADEEVEGGEDVGEACGAESTVSTKWSQLY